MFNRASVSGVSINSYAGAVRRYNDTKPVRGTNIHPLGRRTCDATQTIRMSGDDVIIRLYNTNIVVYHSNGDITLRTGDYDTLLTQQAIDRYSPFHTYRRNGYMVAIINGGHWAIAGDGTRFIAEQDHKPAKPYQIVTRKQYVDRALAKVVRAKLTPILKQSIALATCFAGGTIPDEYRNHYFAGAAVSAVLDGTTTEEDETRLAWASVPAGYDGRIDARINVTQITKKFWEQVYRAAGVRKTRETLVPLGEGLA